MDYFANEVLRKEGHMFHKFEIQETTDQSQDLYYTKERIPVLQYKAQDMIW